MVYQTTNAIRTNLQIIRVSVRQVERALQRLAPMVQSAGGNRSGVGTRRKLRISPARLRVLKLQGEYMGCMRNLSPRKKARVKAVKTKSGFPAAIKLARKLAER